MESDLVEVTFLDWMAQQPEDDPVLLLHWEERNRIIPVWIGLVEASAFAARDNNMMPKRPSMYEVLVDAIEIMGRTVLHGAITGVHEGVFIASLVFEGGVELDMRPSDLVYVCDLLEAPLFVAREVAESVSVPANQLVTHSATSAADSANDSVEESMAEFAEFLDSIDADDFATGREPGDK